MQQREQNIVSNFSLMIPRLSQSVIRKKEEFSQSLNSAFVSSLCKIGEMKTNLMYSIKHSDIAPLSRKEIDIRAGGPMAQLLGYQYSSDQSYKFLFVFRNTFWFTYRTGIKEIESDNGWGCMIRTVQMVFAEVLKRHLSLKDTQQDQYQVIRHFSEQSDGVLSLSAVCTEGRINKRWTTAPEVLAVFKNIMQKNRNYFTFYFQVYSSGVAFKNERECIFPQYPALISLSNRVSLDCIPQEMHPHYFSLMDHPSWVGSIGGLKGQALYIIGSYENRVIFLDPHYVQSNEEELQVNTYFCKAPRGIHISALSPSLSFCYYFATASEHLDWIRWISSTCEKHYPNLIVQYMDETVKARLEKDVQRKEKPQLIMQQVRSDDGSVELQTIEFKIVGEMHEDSGSGQFEVLQ